MERLEHWSVVGPRLEHAVSFAHATAELLVPRLLAGVVGLESSCGPASALPYFSSSFGPGSIPLRTFSSSPRLCWRSRQSWAYARCCLPVSASLTTASLGMLLLLLPGDDMTWRTAPVATLLIRFATLWIDVILGVMSLALLERGTTTGQVRTRSSEAQTTRSESA